MRVGVVVHALSGGGAEAVTRRWIDILVGRGHEVVLYLYGRPGTDPRPLPAGVSVRRFVRAHRLDAWLRLPSWLASRVTDDGVDVVVAVLEFSGIVALFGLRQSGVPVVAVEHGVPTLLWRGRAVGRLKSLLARRLYPRAAAVVAVSHAVATDLRVGLGIDPRRLHVLPNAVLDDDAWDRRPVSSASVPARRLPQRLVLVGRLVATKNFDLAIAAAAVSATRGMPLRVVVFGDGPRARHLRQVAAEAGVELELAGWVEGWTRRLGPGDVVVSTSESEAFGNVLVEAAAHGVPCVALSTSLGVADAMIPGVTGVLAPTASAQAVARAVAEAARLDPAACPRSWLERFTDAGVAPLLDDLLTGVVRSVPGSVRTGAREAPSSARMRP